MSTNRGTFYGVGIGPGDPDLMTIKAMQVISACPVIAAPRTKTGDMIALDIVRKVVPLGNKEVLAMDFTMDKVAAKRQENYKRNADAAAASLDQGRDVAMITLGDVSIYSTVRYIADELSARGYETKMVPGVTSFSAVAASLGISLTEMDEPLHIIPAVWRNPEDYLDLPGTKVLMKAGHRLADTLDLLSHRNLLGKSSLAVNCGMEHELLIPDLEAGEDIPEKTNYFTTIIVKDQIHGGSRHV